MGHFKPITRNMDYLFPPSMNDWLPEQHLARFVVEIVEQVNLQPMERAYGTSGSDAFHPAVLLSILMYGYATGVFSSLKLEQATYRKRFLKEIEVLMVEVLMIARTLGVLHLGNIALDGSKIKANASKHTALSDGHIKKLEAHLQDEVKKLMVLAAAADVVNTKSRR